jgi:prepilin-type N-terminal cleavage/methylation domain-containing protein
MKSTTRNGEPHGRTRNGFTLVEISIVVSIIGLLVVIALPALQKARNESQAAALTNNFRVFDGALQQYSLETGSWPPDDWTSGAYPVGMESNWLPETWIAVTPIGGQYAFANSPATIILVLDDIPPTLMARVDVALDDGGLGTGSIRGDDESLDYIIE